MNSSAPPHNTSSQYPNDNDLKEINNWLEALVKRVDYYDVTFSIQLSRIASLESGLEDYRQLNNKLQEYREIIRTPLRLKDGNVNKRLDLGTNSDIESVTKSIVETAKKASIKSNGSIETPTTKAIKEGIKEVTTDSQESNKKWGISLASKAQDNEKAEKPEKPITVPNTKVSTASSTVSSTIPPSASFTISTKATTKPTTKQSSTIPPPTPTTKLPSPLPTHTPTKPPKPTSNLKAPLKDDSNFNTPEHDANTIKATTTENKQIDYNRSTTIPNKPTTNQLNSSKLETKSLKNKIKDSRPSRSKQKEPTTSSQPWVNVTRKEPETESEIERESEELASEPYTIVVKLLDPSTLLDHHKNRVPVVHKIHRVTQNKFIQSVALTKNQNFLIRTFNKEMTYFDSYSKWIKEIPSQDGVLSSTSWHQAVIHGVPKQTSMIDLQNYIERDNENLHLASTPRPLLPSDKESDDSKFRSVVIAFREEEELDFYLQGGVFANYDEFRVVKYRPRKAEGK